MENLLYTPEPKLQFGYSQNLEDPRDGLSLFGPYDKTLSYGIKYGIVGLKKSISRFQKWVKSIQKPIGSSTNSLLRPPFPGFEAAFKIPFGENPVLSSSIQKRKLEECAYLDDPYQRVYKTVGLFYEKIIELTKHEDEEVDIWIVIIPEYVYSNCRPQSYIGKEDRVEAEDKMSPEYAKKLLKEPSLFDFEDKQAKPYHYDLNFHNQLKARLLSKAIPTQIVRETTIAPQDFLNKLGYPIRQIDKPSSIAWNLATGIYYKAVGRPWKLAEIRDRVCYIGLVFKKTDADEAKKNACCAAQMFLDSGDGIVFKGAVGPWYNPDKGEFHLKRADAKKLIELAIKTYTQKHPNGKPPKELFIHGKVHFNDEEWEGFKSAVCEETNLVGIRIRHENYFKIFKKGERPALRGLSYVIDKNSAYLWTKGYITRLQNYPGMETPNPLSIIISKGEADIKTVLKDIMALTKLNYNACIFSDGIPVTLRFANSIGEILTAGPDLPDTPLSFKYYI